MFAPMRPRPTSPSSIGPSFIARLRLRRSLAGHDRPLSSRRGYRRRVCPAELYHH